MKLPIRVPPSGGLSWKTVSHGPRDRGTLAQLPCCAGRRRGQAAYSLLECVVYTGVFFLVLSLAFMTFYRVDVVSRGLRSNSADILRTLRAGEQWREDIRRASAPVQAGGTAEEPELTIPQTNVVVKYSFVQGAVWRQSGAQRAIALDNVLKSSMEKDPRQFVAGWRWEVELKPGKRPARLKPLFTFTAASREASK